MANQAMRAARGDVRGREIEPNRRRGQSSRDISGQRAMFTQPHGRTTYRGSTRHRDTQVRAGHPLAGLWQSLRGMRRSHRPDVRAYAREKLGGKTHVQVWLDEMAGIDEMARAEL
jgi:hypothetical protein